MRSQRDVQKSFNKLLQDVKEKEFYQIDLCNRVNCYCCSNCSHITKTIDVDAGITPMMFTCENCKETARSSFYRDIAPNQKPSIKWYRPSIGEVMKLRKNESMLSHVLAGGLMHKTIDVDS